MVRISVLNDCLNNIVNAERRGKRQVLIRPSSKVVVKVLSVMQKHGQCPFLSPSLLPPPEYNCSDPALLMETPTRSLL